MADVTITDQQKVQLTATATDANGMVVVDLVNWTTGDFAGDQPFSLGDRTDTTVEVISNGPFLVGSVGTNTVSAQDSVGNVATITVDVTGTQPLPPTSVVITVGEPEPK